MSVAAVVDGGGGHDRAQLQPRWLLKFTVLCKGSVVGMRRARLIKYANLSTFLYPRKVLTLLLQHNVISSRNGCQC